MNTAILVVRSVVSVIVGYALMVVLITVAQEGIFGGVSYSGSTLPVLAVAGLLTMLSAVAGGAVTALLAPCRRLAHASVIPVLVAIETIGFAATGGAGSGDPIWFDLMAGGSLMVGAMLGAIGVVRWRRPALTATPAAG